MSMEDIPDDVAVVEPPVRASRFRAGTASQGTRPSSLGSWNQMRSSTSATTGLSDLNSALRYNAMTDAAISSRRSLKQAYGIYGAASRGIADKFGDSKKTKSKSAASKTTTTTNRRKAVKKVEPDIVDIVEDLDVDLVDPRTNTMTVPATPPKPVGSGLHQMLTRSQPPEWMRPSNPPEGSPRRALRPDSGSSSRKSKAETPQPDEGSSIVFYNSNRKHRDEDLYESGSGRRGKGVTSNDSLLDSENSDISMFNSSAMRPGTATSTGVAATPYADEAEEGKRRPGSSGRPVGVKVSGMPSGSDLGSFRSRTMDTTSKGDGDTVARRPGGSGVSYVVSPATPDPPSRGRDSSATARPREKSVTRTLDGSKRSESSAPGEPPSSASNSGSRTTSATRVPVSDMPTSASGSSNQWDDPGVSAPRRQRAGSAAPRTQIEPGIRDHTQRHKIMRTKTTSAGKTRSYTQATSSAPWLPKDAENEDGSPYSPPKAQDASAEMEVEGPWTWVRDFRVKRPPSRQLPPPEALYLEETADLLHGWKPKAGEHSAATRPWESSHSPPSPSSSLRDADNTPDNEFEYYNEPPNPPMTAPATRPNGTASINTSMIPDGPRPPSTRSAGRRPASAGCLGDMSGGFVGGFLDPDLRPPSTDSSSGDGLLRPESTALEERDSLFWMRPPSRQRPPPQALHLELPPQRMLKRPGSSTGRCKSARPARPTSAGVPLSQLHGFASARLNGTNGSTPAVTAATAAIAAGMDRVTIGPGTADRPVTSPFISSTTSTTPAQITSTTTAPTTTTTTVSNGPGSSNNNTGTSAHRPPSAASAHSARPPSATSSAPEGLITAFEAPSGSFTGGRPGSAAAHNRRDVYLQLVAEDAAAAAAAGVGETSTWGLVTTPSSQQGNRASATVVPPGGRPPAKRPPATSEASRSVSGVSYTGGVTPSSAAPSKDVGAKEAKEEREEYVQRLTQPNTGSGWTAAPPRPVSHRRGSLSGLGSTQPENFDDFDFDAIGGCPWGSGSSSDESDEDDDEQVSGSGSEVGGSDGTESFLVQDEAVPIVKRSTTQDTEMWDKLRQHVRHWAVSNGDH
mmetsp:Transcript_28893/g.66804  ORF Transcript_28893/g.66804 Transcript_28893/m.66804 type:complete len:1079 (-) Transcript_28893:86-3322(-)|eukprot:CAMPEP_0114543374 /NCGR_PEP_ID=MMETSP0114-20121206/2321_1 /TAXON_ID=31324 /ORGANISM="Goniomonas sp, Strain m" /LENGTH=1078 /DNA_ID=CAMNT_0001727707 /DNA_START=23 /DNA_END=3259 /DNA_ORIENTATION=+